MVKAPSLKVPRAPKVPKGLGLLAKFRWAIPLLGLVAFAALVWYGGPFIAFGTLVPLEGVTTRIIVILVVVLVVAVLALVRLCRRHRANAALVEGIAGTSDEAVLTERMADAIATLKQSAGGRGADPLYVLPWYIIIGPSGAGKTTALVHSGLKFPLTEGDTPINGIGGTRYCDWWFHDEAVLVDTAGRLSTHDSNPDTDRRSWLSFLELLSNNRPRQPINGVVVAMSLQDLLDPAKAAQVETDTTAIRKRLAELHDSLKIDFPVYVWFTKADLIAGFSEFFADLDEAGRRQVWGVTFQTSDRRANMISKAPAELELLIQRVGSRITQRLDEEPDLRSRAILFGFPAQLTAMQKPVLTFLDRVFEPTRFHANATLRGFYFVSGTQEGNPLDQVVGALARSFGVVESRAASAYSGTGRSYFLHDVLKRVIFPEAGWVSTNIAAVRRARAFRIAAFSLIAVLTVGIGAAWATSFINNRNLIQTFNADVDDYLTLSLPIRFVGTPDPFGAEVILEPGLEPIYSALVRLEGIRSLIAAPGTITEGFGLGQRHGLAAAAEAAYRTALEYYLRPRLIMRLEQEVNQHNADPIFLYETLKVYLMLGDATDRIPVDNQLIIEWFKRDWLATYPFDDVGRRQLEAHLTAMLTLDTGSGHLVESNQVFVDAIRVELADVTLAQQAYAILRSEAPAYGMPLWRLTDRERIPRAADVFETTRPDQRLQDLAVDAFYTRDGFQLALLDRLPSIACLVNKDAWVLDRPEPVSRTDGGILAGQLLALYGEDFIAAWRTVLDGVALRRVDLPVLERLAGPNSALAVLVEEIVAETALTVATNPSGANTELVKAREDGCRNSALALTQRQISGADVAPIENSFADVKAIPIAEIVGVIREIYRSQSVPRPDPDAARTESQRLRTLAGQLVAVSGALPATVAAMVAAVADQARVFDFNRSDTVLERDLAEIAYACERIVASYPFDRRSTVSTPVEAFDYLFAPGTGLFDLFFENHLQAAVDTTGATWRFNDADAADRLISEVQLQEFRRAAAIRQAFFPADLMTITPLNPAGVAVDPRLLSILDQAAREFDLKVEVFSGVAARLSGTVNHPTGRAVDLLIFDARGMPIANYNSAIGFDAYERFAKIARTVQQRLYPELNQDFRWGGYFINGGADLMHFDLSGGGMGGGTWTDGLTASRRQDVMRMGAGEIVYTDLRFHQFSALQGSTIVDIFGTTGRRDVVADGIIYSPGFRTQARAGSRAPASLLVGRTTIDDEPIQMTWTTSADTSLILGADNSARVAFSASGAWSLMRVLDSASTRGQGAVVTATFTFGGQTAAFEFRAGSNFNPLNLRELREFACPG